MNYEFKVSSDDEEIIKIYVKAMSTYQTMNDIYNVARRYDKHIEPTENNYYQLCDDIKELSYNE